MSALQLILGTKKKSRKQWDVTQTRRRQRKQQKQHKMKSRTRTKTKRFGRKSSLLFNLWIGALALYLLVVYRMFFSGESNSNSNSNPPQHTIEDYLSRVRANGHGQTQMTQSNNWKQEEVPQKERDDFRIKDLPRHCTSNHINNASAPFEFKEIIIKGERHSGTNWITSILEKNVKEGITVNQESLDIGWKHGFLPPEGKRTCNMFQFCPFPCLSAASLLRSLSMIGPIMCYVIHVILLYIPLYSIFNSFSW